MKRIVFYLAMLIGTFMFASCATDHVVVYRDYPSRTIIYTNPYCRYNYAYRPLLPRPHYHYVPKPHSHHHNHGHSPAVHPKQNPKPSPRPPATVRPNTGHINGGSMSGKRR